MSARKRSDDTSHEGSTKTCPQCQNDIPATAHKCHQCGSFAATWRNELPYWSSTVALFLVVISAITYLYPALKNRFFPDDGIDLVALSSDSHAIIRNTSDTPSFLFQLRILARANEQEMYEYTAQILDSIEPNSHKEAEIDFRRKRLFVGDEVLQTITYGVKMSDDQWNRAVALAIEDARNPGSREKQGPGCYQVHFFLPDGIYLADLRSKCIPSAELGYKRALS